MEETYGCPVCLLYLSEGGQITTLWTNILPLGPPRFGPKKFLVVLGFSRTSGVPVGSEGLSTELPVTPGGVKGRKDLQLIQDSSKIAKKVHL